MRALLPRACLSSPGFAPEAPMRQRRALLPFLLLVWRGEAPSHNSFAENTHSQVTGACASRLHSPRTLSQALAPLRWDSPAAAPIRRVREGSARATDKSTRRLRISSSPRPGGLAGIPAFPGGNARQDYPLPSSRPSLHAPAPPRNHASSISPVPYRFLLAGAAS